MRQQKLENIQEFTPGDIPQFSNFAIYIRNLLINFAIYIHLVFIPGKLFNLIELNILDRMEIF